MFKSFPRPRAFALIFASSVFYGLCFNCFFSANHINMGGLTGVGQIVHYLIPALPVGGVVFVLNVPLFFLSWKLLGRKFLISSMIAAFLTSFWVDTIAALCTFPPMDPMLASIFGGLSIGTALGVVFLQSATTGGTDLIARLLKLKVPYLPMGVLLLCVDLTVVTVSAVVFRSFYSALYALIGLWTSATMTDKVLYGLNNSKVAYIISPLSDQLIPALSDSLERGITILHGSGGFSRQPVDVLMCAFKEKQIVDLKQTVKDIDPNAFLIVCNAHDVLGEGFHFYDPHGV